MEGFFIMDSHSARIPVRLDVMRTELTVYVSGFNEHRPHQGLDGCTPKEIYEDVIPLSQARHLEFRPACRGTRNHAVPGRLRLAVTYHEGRRQLPIIGLKWAA